MIVEAPLSDTAAMQQINRFLSDADGATVFHTPEWNRIVSEVFGTQFLFLVQERGGCLRGLMPCHLVARSRRLVECHSPARMFETPYGGPVAVNPAANDTCLKLAKAASALKGSRHLALFTSPRSPPWPLPRGWKTAELVTACVDLAPALEDIWMHSVDGKRRNMIRKAKKHGVEVRYGGSDLVSIYYDLVQQMTRRAGITLHPREYYARVLETFWQSDAARLYLAFRDGQALAGGVFLRFGSTAYYWHGANASGAPNLGQGELIQWHVIQWAKEKGCRWYDLVGVEKERLPRIAEFKLGFSRNLVPFRFVGHTPLRIRVLRRIATVVREGWKPNNG